MLKYHYGLKSKKIEGLPNIEWITEFNYNEWIWSVVNHKGRNTK